MVFNPLRGGYIVHNGKRRSAFCIGQEFVELLFIDFRSVGIKFDYNSVGIV